jgi:hypothetical protein
MTATFLKIEEKSRVDQRLKRYQSLPQVGLRPGTRLGLQNLLCPLLGILLLHPVGSRRRLPLYHLGRVASLCKPRRRLQHQTLARAKAGAHYNERDGLPKRGDDGRKGISDGMRRRRDRQCLNDEEQCGHRILVQEYSGGDLKASTTAPASGPGTEKLGLVVTEL